MATIRLPPDFSELLRSFNTHRVEYLVVGGYAVGKHGYPRATVDLDVWVGPTEQNARRVIAALTEFGFEVRELTPDLFSKPSSLVRMGVPPMRIEIMTSVSGIAFDEAYDNRVSEDIDGVAVLFISLEFLKKNKRASGRYKDFNDLENLP